MRNHFAIFLFAMAVTLVTAFGACMQKTDEQFLNSIKQDCQQADSSLVALRSLQAKFASLKQLIEAAPEDVKKSAGQRMTDLQMAADEYAQKVSVNLEPYQQEINKGKQLADDYASGKVTLDAAKTQYTLLTAEYRGITEMATEFKTTFEQFDTEFRTLAKDALSKAAPAPVKKQ